MMCRFTTATDATPNNPRAIARLSIFPPVMLIRSSDEQRIYLIDLRSEEDTDSTQTHVVLRSQRQQRGSLPPLPTLNSTEQHRLTNEAGDSTMSPVFDM